MGMHAHQGPVQDVCGLPAPLRLGSTRGGGDAQAARPAREAITSSRRQTRCWATAKGAGKRKRFATVLIPLPPPPLIEAERPALKNADVLNYKAGSLADQV